MNLYTKDKRQTIKSYKLVLKMNDDGTPQKNRIIIIIIIRRRRTGIIIIIMRRRRRRRRRRREENVKHEDHDFDRNNILGQIPPSLW